VIGCSFPDGGPYPPALTPRKTGVYGRAVQDVDARGVTGESTLGRGINGIATGGTGVYGSANGGEGVHGTSIGSNGVSGESASGIASGVFGLNTGGGYGVAGTSSTGTGVSANTTSGIAVNALAQSGGMAVAATSIGGTALQVSGRATFSTAGLTVVAVGTRSKVVAPGLDVKATSLLLCTLESNQPGLAIQRVTKNTSTDTFTVYLSAVVAAGKTAKVGWFLIG